MLKIDNDRKIWLITLEHLKNPDLEDIRLDITSYLSREISSYLLLKDLPDIINEDTVKNCSDESRVAISSFEILQGLTAAGAISVLIEGHSGDEEERKIQHTTMVNHTELLCCYYLNNSNNTNTLKRVIKFNKEEDFSMDFYNYELLSTENLLPNEEGDYLLLLYKVKEYFGMFDNMFFSVVIPYKKIEEEYYETT